MNEFYFWGATFIVGLLLLKLVPAEKLKGANTKMREKMPGVLIVILYILIGGILIGGTYMSCFFFKVPSVLQNILIGSLLGVFIGLIPLVDPRNLNKGDK